MGNLDFLQKKFYNIDYRTLTTLKVLQVSREEKKRILKTTLVLKYLCLSKLLLYLEFVHGCCDTLSLFFIFFLLFNQFYIIIYFLAGFELGMPEKKVSTPTSRPKTRPKKKSFLSPCPKPKMHTVSRDSINVANSGSYILVLKYSLAKHSIVSEGS